MKRLTLIRHGAATDALEYHDIDRPLNTKGLKQAAVMGRLLKDAGFNFDQMFCSTAQRALSTATIIHGALHPANHSLCPDKALYTFDAKSLYHFIEMIDDRIEHAVIVAHNPGLSCVANDLLTESIREMSTCTILQMQLNINEWIAIKPRCGQLIALNTPD